MYDFNKEKQDYTQRFYELMLSVMTSNGGGGVDLSAPRMTLIGTTRLKIDELMPQREGVQFIQTTSNNVSNVLDLYINGLLDESTKHILQTAPRHIIKAADGSGSTVVPVSGKTWGYVKLPSDYLRFVSLKMASWYQEVSNPITTLDPKYKLQKYPATMGGVAKPVVVLNSVKQVNTPIAQVDRLTLTGTSGSVNIACAGILRPLNFNVSLSMSATEYVEGNAEAFAAGGVTLTRENETIVFTASVPGVPFAHPWIANVSGDMSGTVVQSIANVPPTETVRVAEYYSVKDAAVHTLDALNYIALVGADYLQDDLTDALTWLCAGKVLQIMGSISGQAGSAEKAFEQMNLSFQNLL